MGKEEREIERRVQSFLNRIIVGIGSIFCVLALFSIIIALTTVTQEKVLGFLVFFYELFKFIFAGFILVLWISLIGHLVIETYGFLKNNRVNKRK